MLSCQKKRFFLVEMRRFLVKGYDIFSKTNTHKIASSTPGFFLPTSKVKNRDHWQRTYNIYNEIQYLTSLKKSWRLHWNIWQPELELFFRDANISVFLVFECSENGRVWRRNHYLHISSNSSTLGHHCCCCCCCSMTTSFCDIRVRCLLNNACGLVVWSKFELKVWARYSS